LVGTSQCLGSGQRPFDTRCETAGETRIEEAEVNIEQIESHDGSPAAPATTPGQRLRDVREVLGLSLREAAARSGRISHVAIQKIEKKSGTLESVSLGSLTALARAYNLPVDVVIAIARGRLDDERDAELLDLVTLTEENRRYRSALGDIRQRLQVYGELA
jgi:transcriptional regulator with XRE-family HTH domain